MKLTNSLQLSLHALRRHPTRAVLTALGIIIGIAAVIAIMEIGEGSSKSIKRSIETMGAGTIIIAPGSFSASAVQQSAGSRMSLKPEDVASIERECPSVDLVSPLVQARGLQATYKNNNWQPAQINGCGHHYLNIRNWKIADGRAITEADVNNNSSVCVIGKTIVNELFGKNEDPIGKIIRIKGQSITVVGVLELKGGNMGGQDQDDFIALPWTTLRQRMAGASSSVSTSTSSSSSTSTNALYPSSGVNLYPAMSATQKQNTLVLPRFNYIDTIQASAIKPELIDRAIEEIKAVLREKHKIKDGERDDFTVINFAEVTNMITGVSTLLANLLLGVALVSLLVGGVGIMNIMLVSVTERTREIGLRMAVGATSNDILKQFLTEAVVLCLFGGVVGIIFGHGSAMLVNHFLTWPIETSISMIIIAVVVAASIGIIFGFYPAMKAAKLDPIEALRYE